jgi:hypothetical protein
MYTYLITLLAQEAQEDTSSKPRGHRRQDLCG